MKWRCSLLSNPDRLRWPRIVGTRNGRPFWYSVALPDIVRGRAGDCAAPDAFYRVPWTDGVSRITGQGGNKPTSHNGSQAFAFSMDSGETIRAAHGGSA